jgi:hypothetical protein
MMSIVKGDTHRKDKTGLKQLTKDGGLLTEKDWIESEVNLSSLTDLGIKIFQKAMK